MERLIILRQTANPLFQSLSITQSLLMMWREEGPKSLFKGNGVNVLRIAPFTAFEFLFFGFFKDLLKIAGLSDKLSQTGSYLIAGGFAGMTASTLVMQHSIFQLIVNRSILWIF
eukprot:TRINITY_DN6176_c0_g3_i1.p1 TRINITY_DN6176_c0_g3~~TRINITY_DN6176_c0_g3_i1.p1  ORF type:complete len:114 (-),score=18.96 TRINITY_DN6176_c0_g3_i1:176-517(-)